MDSTKTKSIVIAAIVGALALGSVGIAGAAGAKALTGSKNPASSAEATRGTDGPGVAGKKQGSARDGKHDGARDGDRDGDRGKRGFGGQGDIAEALAKLSGLTEDEIRTKRGAGTSYAEIAKSKGVTTDALIAETIKIETAELDAAIKAGTLTQAQKTEVLKDIESRLAAEVKSTDAGKGGRDGKRSGHGDRDGKGSHGSRDARGSSATQNSDR